MAGALKKTLYLLGLADEEEYESYDDSRDEPEQVEPRRRAEVTPLRSVSSAPVVREAAMGSLNRITTIHPRSYNEARHIGEAFREGTPVIMNLTEMDEAEAKRLVDFAAGLAFGLHGSLERVTAKVFLITPESVEVEGGAPEGQPVLFNQS